MAHHAARPRRAPTLRLLSVTALLAAAAATAGTAVVGGSEPVADTAAAPAPSAPAPAAAEGPWAPGAPTGPDLAVAENRRGTVVTNDGFTVYRFEKDTPGSGTSSCSGACAQAWPPVLAGDTPSLEGVPPDEVGTVTRPDGTEQLTLGGWPLYRYAQDTRPGDANGHGVGGTWCAVGPDGEPAELSPARPGPAATSPSRGSYGSGSTGSGSTGSGSTGGYSY